MLTQPRMPTREDLIALRDGEGLNREEIAAYYNTSLATVKRWIARLDVPTSVEPRRKRRPQLCQREAIANDTSLTVIERARRILGPRMNQDQRGYTLDGRPVKVEALLAAAGIRFDDEVAKAPLAIYAGHNPRGRGVLPQVIYRKAS